MNEKVLNRQNNLVSCGICSEDIYKPNMRVHLCEWYRKLAVQGMQISIRNLRYNRIELNSFGIFPAMFKSSRIRESFLREGKFLASLKPNSAPFRQRGRDGQTLFEYAFASCPFPYKLPIIEPEICVESKTFYNCPDCFDYDVDLSQHFCEFKLIKPNRNMVIELLEDETGNKELFLYGNYAPDGHEYSVVTATSKIGEELFAKLVGDTFKIETQVNVWKSYEIISIQKLSGELNSDRYSEGVPSFGDIHPLQTVERRKFGRDFYT